MTQTALYRHYAGDDLFYVGVSVSPLHRLRQHSQTAAWFRSVSRVEIEWFETREEALDAERSAISREMPTYNLHHTAERAASKLIKAIGSARLAKELGVCVNAVTNKSEAEKLPCSWAYIMAIHCIRLGMSCPANAFGWRAVSPDDSRCITEIFSLDAAGERDMATSNNSRAPHFSTP